MDKNGASLSIIKEGLKAMFSLNMNQMEPVAKIQRGNFK